MIHKKGEFNFKDFTNKVEDLKKNLPKIIGNEAKNHFLEGFRRGGGQTDKSASGWQPRKPAKTPRQDQRSVGRALLVDTGAMRADIAVRQATFNKIAINTIHVPYAIYHNEGTSRLPQREFIGDSKVLERKIRELVDYELKKIAQ